MSTPASAKEVVLWEEDEVELLLSSVIEYKSQRTMAGIDWESVRSKYQDILRIYLDNVPSSEASFEYGKFFPHGKKMTKDTVVTKIKAIRLKYREAVDNGRRSGHGRVVHLFEKIWGGSPATEQIPAGIDHESSEVHPVEADAEDSDSLPIDDEPASPTLVTPPPGTSTPATPTTTVDREDLSVRRNLLDSKLKNYRHSHEKLKRKASSEAQLPSLAKEDLSLKRKCLGLMAAMEDEHKKYARLENMSKLTDAISNGFGLLRQALCSPHPSQMYGSFPGPVPLGNQMPLQPHPQSSPASHSRSANDGTTLDISDDSTSRRNIPGYSSAEASSFWQNPQNYCSLNLTSIIRHRQGNCLHHNHTHSHNCNLSLAVLSSTVIVIDVNLSIPGCPEAMRLI